MDKDIVSIVFLPVCAKCFKIIWQEVDAPQSDGVIDGSPRLMGAKYDISPDTCPHCGAWFDSIKIPTKLPFNSYDYVT